MQTLTSYDTGCLKMKRRFWTNDEIEYMMAHYSDTPTEELTAALGRSERSVYQQARLLGLLKSPEYLKKHGNRLQPGHKKGSKTQFKPGHNPHNKGKKGWQAGGDSAKTRFQKGSLPHNWKPVGSIRRTKEGILQRKMTDTRCTQRDWKALHAMLWEEHFGKIPKGHIVRFRNLNTNDITIDNLECISRAENMKRNSIHNLPEPLVELVRLRGVLNRHINKKGGKHEKQDRGPEESPVRHH